MAGQNPPRDEAQRLFAFFDNATDGFFAEVGVRHLTVGSVSWPLETAGWKGVLVEPQPDIAAFLVTVRSAQVVAAACVASDKAGEPLALRIASPLSSIDVGRPPAAAASNYVIMVPTRTLDDILQEAEGPMPIDLLALDANGLELDALLGFDFRRWRPRLIVIADPAVDLQRHRFLKESGYRLVRRADGRGWYVVAGTPAAERRARWGIVRDYYLLLPLRKLRRALSRLKARIVATAE
jgi:FkbM family methyltransferase